MIKQKKHRRRAKAVRGKNEDKGRYFKCKQCGFICDIQRDDLEDGESMGVTHEVFQIDGVDAGYKPVVTSGCPKCGSKNWL